MSLLDPTSDVMAEAYAAIDRAVFEHRLTPLHADNLRRTLKLYNDVETAADIIRAADDADDYASGGTSGGAGAGLGWDVGSTLVEAAQKTEDAITNTWDDATGYVENKWDEGAAYVEGKQQDIEDWWTQQKADLGASLDDAANAAQTGFFWLLLLVVAVAVAKKG